MRIAMISEHASPLAVLGGEDAGGQNTHVAELSAALSAAGHEVRVYTRLDAVDLPVTVRTPDGYDVVHVPAGPAEPVAKDDLLPYMPAFGEWLAERWRTGDWQPEVVHAHFWMSGLAGLAAGRRTGVPVVQTYHALGTVKRRHQGAQDTSPPGRLTHERELGRSVDRVVAQCQDEVAELVRMGVPRSRMTVVPSGVNLSTFAPLGPVAERDGDRPRILTVGRLVERKGFQDVIRATALVPDAECVVVGGPPAGLLETDPYALRLRALAESCGVADRVRLIGAVPREEMGRWYRSADVLVAAPWYEPFGLTPLEAMACGVPVIGTAVGGLIDTVVAGRTGDLVPARDPAALGAAIRGLLGDRIRRFAYATAALERARNRYSWTTTAERLAELYAEVSTVRRPTRVVA
ncbi:MULTISPECIES: glycosyltransferase [Micromonospora]|uniref:Glycosyltransferase family 1 protein n=1 Tax=Micromonospora solifontis TaxID=2487138 RepID=A0ABX9WJ61_9ACTN|nr:MULTISPECIES: glycosyltransferase [Micromonospora]NES15479.1 glycosyltransferase family 1 protein [Micromonospora sp. PPF5-17B]NES35775.1 glycosyltransferase family 1 protein [Micromonospora solifontis]NES55611.1 glycosyltransferase family 1 protein [Micromonospora sp. PPF5-6]RNM00258.1 glycosyltransferase family 1 protein [Micromonospora solifontis]